MQAKTDFFLKCPSCDNIFNLKEFSPEIECDSCGEMLAASDFSDDFVWHPRKKF